jgi:hypothetical protein
VEAVEPATIGDELRPLFLEHFPDRLFRTLGMGVGLRPHQAPIEQPGVKFVVAWEPGFWDEEALADEPDLVLVPHPFSQPAAGVQATGSTR